MTERVKERMAIVIVESSKADDGQYIPCVATEGQSGYRPLSGKGPFAAPWKWGRDRKIAQQLADERNKSMGLSKEESVRIIASSMRE